MNIKLMICSTVAFLTACGTTQTEKTRVSSGSYPDRRVEGQWAREAGMHEREWYVKRNSITTEPQLAAAVELSQGGAATAGQAVTVSTGSSNLEILDQAEIELRKEELVVGKREVSNGGVLVRTIVQTEDVSQPIDLRREEYIIERIPAGSGVDQQARTEGVFEGREIYIPLMREQAVSGKRTLITEAIKIGKRIETDQQTVTMPVRTEDVQIVRDPNLSDPKFASVPRRAPISTMQTERGTGSSAESISGELKLRKEELIVSKQETDAGGIYVQKVIRTENVSQPVQLHREEYTVERSPASGEVSNADFSQRQMALELKREEPVAGTRNYVAETVRVRKQMQTDKQMVTGTIRKEAAEIVKLTDKEVTGQGGTGISEQSGVALFSESSTAEKSKDQLLKEHVESILVKNGSVPEESCCKIGVAADKGVVTLTGTVSSEKQRKEIGKQVAKMSGVRSVKNQLTVKAP